MSVPRTFDSDSPAAAPSAPAEQAGAQQAGNSDHRRAAAGAGFAAAVPASDVEARRVVSCLSPESPDGFFSARLVLPELFTTRLKAAYAHRPEGNWLPLSKRSARDAPKGAAEVAFLLHAEVLGDKIRAKASVRLLSQAVPAVLVFLLVMAVGAIVIGNRSSSSVPGVFAVVIGFLILLASAFPICNALGALGDKDLYALGQFGSLTAVFLSAIGMTMLIFAEGRPLWLVAVMWVVAGNLIGGVLFGSVRFTFYRLAQCDLDGVMAPALVVTLETVPIRWVFPSLSCLGRPYICVREIKISEVDGIAHAVRTELGHEPSAEEFRAHAEMDTSMFWFLGTVEDLVDADMDAPVGQQPGDADEMARNAKRRTDEIMLGCCGAAGAGCCSFIC